MHFYVVRIVVVRLHVNTWQNYCVDFASHVLSTVSILQ